MTDTASPWLRHVMVHAGRIALPGDLSVVANPVGLVMFAHGSGSSRHSPRNREVARALVADGFATLLFDLLSPEEERSERDTGHMRFDVELLAGRMVGALDWVRTTSQLRTLPIGLFGASTGAAAALIAASRSSAVRAVVSRGGRPDLAGAALASVRCPTLLIVGGNDGEVLALNRDAAARLGGLSQIRVINGAGHLFEEPGALAQVTRLASSWFRAHLSATVSPQAPLG